MKNHETYNLSSKDVMLILLSGTARYGKIEKIIYDLSAENFEDVIINASKEKLLIIGFTENEAMKIISAREIMNRALITLQKKKLIQIKKSSDIFEYMNPFVIGAQYEEFHAIFMNRANRIIKHEMISLGSETGTVVSIKKIAKIAIECLASACILSHNHPSGNKEPSDADKSITQKVKGALMLIDVSLLDHVIIGNAEYYSFADEGII